VNSDVDEKPAARSAVGLLAVIAAGTAFGALLLLVRVKWAPLHALDIEAAEDLNERVAPHPLLVSVLRLVTDLGSPLFVTTVVTVAVVVLLWRRRFATAGFLAVTGIGGLILSPTLKNLVGRLRPVVEVPLQTASGNSFPSGHALGATIAYGSLLLVVLPRIPPRGRPYLVGFVVLLVAAVAFTRVALGVHYVSDVVGGCLLGAAWIGVVAWAFRPGLARDLERSRAG
jgi:undecaprenyl-diphosphatase